MQDTTGQRKEEGERKRERETLTAAESSLPELIPRRNFLENCALGGEYQGSDRENRHNQGPAHLSSYTCGATPVVQYHVFETSGHPFLNLE